MQGLISLPIHHGDNLSERVVSHNLSKGALEGDILDRLPDYRLTALHGLVNNVALHNSRNGQEGTSSRESDYAFLGYFMRNLD